MEYMYYLLNARYLPHTYMPILHRLFDTGVLDGIF